MNLEQIYFYLSNFGERIKHFSGVDFKKDNEVIYVHSSIATLEGQLLHLSIFKDDILNKILISDNGDTVHSLSCLGKNIDFSQENICNIKAIANKYPSLLFLEEDFNFLEFTIEFNKNTLSSDVENLFLFLNEVECFLLK